LALASRDNRLGTLHSDQIHGGIVGVLEPVESEVATILKLGRQLGTLGSRRHTAVASAPTISWRIPLVLAAVEDAHTTTRNLDVEVVGSEVTASVGHLYHHLLAGYRGRGEGDLVASTAPELEQGFEF